MKKAVLSELNFRTRKEAVGFLKRLWNSEQTACPICGTILEPLHKKAKKDNSDWQCKTCQKTFKTIHMLDEINEQMPD